MITLGIDPGTSRIGYGLINSGNNLKLIDCGLIEIFDKSISKFSSLADRFEKLIKKTNPDLVALEKIYFARNQKTAIEVAQARGILILLTLQNKIRLIEYGPVEIKQAVTGYGLADKKSVAKMVSRILKIDKIKGPDDISDAVAIAITAAVRYNPINQLNQ